MSSNFSSNKQGMTLLELVLSMTMLSVIVGAGAIVGNSPGWMSSLVSSDLEVQSSTTQLFLRIDHELKDFVKSKGGSYQLETGQDASQNPYLKIVDLSRNGYVYRFLLSGGMSTASLKRYDVVAGVDENATAKTLYQNAVDQYPLLMPSAVLAKDYNSDGNITQADADLILACNNSEIAFVMGAACSTKPGVSWMFEKSANNRIVYLSFRLINKMKGSNRFVLSKSYTKTVYLHELT